MGGSKVERVLKKDLIEKKCNFQPKKVKSGIIKIIYPMIVDVLVAAAAAKVLSAKC